MKLSLLVFALLLSSSFLKAQVESFQINEEQPELINQYVVIEKDSMSINDGYNKVLEWVKITYNTPKEVIKAQLQDDYIRIEGSSKAITTMNILGMPHAYLGKYSITFEFKENKIKMEITRLQVYNQGSQYSSGGWSDQSPSISFQTKNNGKPRKKSIVKYNQGFVVSMNGLRLSLQEYVNNTKKSKVKKDDW